MRVNGAPRRGGGAGGPARRAGPAAGRPGRQARVSSRSRSPQVPRGGARRLAVEAVPQHGMPDGGEVGPQLVGAPGAQAGDDERRPRAVLHHPVGGEGLLEARGQRFRWRPGRGRPRGAGCGAPGRAPGPGRSPPLLEAARPPGPGTPAAAGRRPAAGPGPARWRCRGRRGAAPRCPGRGGAPGAPGPAGRRRRSGSARRRRWPRCPTARPGRGGRGARGAWPRPAASRPRRGRAGGDPAQGAPCWWARGTTPARRPRGGSGRAGPLPAPR